MNSPLSAPAHPSAPEALSPPMHVVAIVALRQHRRHCLASARRVARGTWDRAYWLKRAAEDRRAERWLWAAE